ncbi:TonB-dependent receptor domain-containing protein [Sphingomonas arantia]|uniref:TonB-dependent receptor domain-containing protein n=1 Tax=Sphingomonas arantia TaxID=1460676 RepID=A0ABW4TVE3_9SPHN
MKLDIRTRLLASTLLVGAAIAAQPAYAQAATDTAQSATAVPSGTQTQDTVAAAGGQDENSSGEIVVTGSLIRNPNLVQSSPVLSVGAEEVSLRQSNVAEQFLRELPGVVPSIGSAVNNGNGGASFVDLRGLGNNRNLVLLDGARIAPSGLNGVTDLNNIPLALIERTDVLTGGASTTYGADAVAGVVNFVTRRDFAGVEVNASNQLTEKGDGHTFRTDITIGANFDDGRGNAVFSVGYQQADPVYQGDRSFSRNNVDSFSGVVGGGSGTTVPGVFSLTGVGNRQINPDTGSLVPTYQLFNFNPQNIFQTPFERFNMFGAAHYEVADGIEVYNQGLFSKNSVSTVIASSGTFGNSLTIPYSNPYLPAAARTQFCNANGLTAAQCTAAATAQPTLADGSVNPAYRTFVTNASRRFVEAGPRVNEYTTQIFNYRAGVRGDITDSIGFDISGAYGESENTSRQTGNGTLTRLRQAALATNTTSCVDPTNGCVPINLFGPDGSITEDQLGFLLGVTNSTTTRTTLAQARAVVNGDFGVVSPLGTNPISFAAGGEFRKYTAAVISDSLTQTPNEVLGNGAASPDVFGQYNVYEGFGELIMPLIEDRPFFKSLTLEAGARYSDYSTSGGNFTWKVGGSWEPVDALKLRGNYQKAARSPNIGELFSPEVTGLDNLAVDPCQGAAPANNANLRAVCLAQGAPVSSIGNISAPSASQANITQGGNPNLDVEKATTWTVGAVFQPDFIRGLSFTADYYNIKVTDAITSPTVGDVIGACFGANPTAPSAGAATSVACTSIRRDPLDGTFNGVADGLPLPLSNLGRITTDGIDVSLNYRRDLGFAVANFSALGNWTNSKKFQATPTSLNRECVSYYSVNCASIQPEFSGSFRTTLSFGKLDISALYRYIDAVQYEPAQNADDIANATTVVNGVTTINQAGIVNPEFQNIGAEHYVDLTLRAEASDHLTMTVGVMNLFNNQPKVVGASVGSTAYNSGNVYPSTYDALGRRYAVSARLKF